MKSPEKFFKNIFKHITKKEIITFIFSFVLGILIYYPMSCKWLGNADSVWNSFIYRNTYYTEVSMGRSALFFLSLFFHFEMVSSHIYTVFSILLLSIIVILINRILNIKSLINNIIVSLFIILSPSVSSTLIYYYCSDFYMLAYLLSVLSVYAAIKNFNLKGFIISCILLTFSLFLYQSYISMAASLFLLYLIKKLLCSEYDIKSFFKNLSYFLLIGVISVTIYIVTLNLSTTELHYSRNFVNIIGTNILMIPTLIKEMFIAFYQYFFGNAILNNTWAGKYILNIIFFIFLFVLFIFIIIKNKLYKSFKKLLLLLMCIFLVPISLFLIILTKTESVSIYYITGLLMIPAMNLIYIFAVSLCEFKIHNIIKWLNFALCLVLILYLIIFTAVFNNCLQLTYNQTKTVSDLIINTISDTCGYYDSMPICFIGDFTYRKLSTKQFEFI